MPNNNDQNIIEVSIKGLSPINEANLKLSCLNLFVGPNSSGKSLTMELLWIIDKAISTMISTEFIVLILPKIADKLMEKELTADDILREMFKSPSKSYKEFLHKFELIDLAKDAVVTLKKGDITLEVGVHDGFKVEGIENLTNSLRKQLGETSQFMISTMGDEKLANVNLELLLAIIVATLIVTDFVTVCHSRNFMSNFFANLVNAFINLPSGIEGFIDILPPTFSLFVPDGRSGLLRSLEHVYSLDTAFISSFTISKTKFDWEKVSDVGKLLMESLAVEEVNLEAEKVRFPWGWTTIRKAPSGVRETLPLLSILETLNVASVYVEEPEAHLHPEAIQRIAIYLSYHSKKKKLTISTHSDYLIMTINDLLMSKKLNEHELEKIWGIPKDIMKLALPDKVSLSVFKRSGDGVEVTSKVYEDSFDEDVIEEINEAVGKRRLAIIGALP